MTHLSFLSWVRCSKFFSSFCGLLLIFIITSCYVLSCERTTLLTAPAALGSDTVQNIITKVKFTPRTVPDVTQLLRQEKHIFSVIPPHFLPDVKTPCWYEEHRGNQSTDPYKTNPYGQYSRQTRAVFQRLRNTFAKRLILRDGNRFRFRCLPYFYIIGQPKCGTTDVCERLKLHPDVRLTALKEPHWWSRRRFGIIKPREGFRTRYSVEDYLDLFDMPAQHVQNTLLENSSSNIIIGEASASTMWDNNAWLNLQNSSPGAEPPSLTLDFIHALQPNARFIAILRDPVERLYSDYLYFGTSNKSSEDFHMKVSECLMLFDGCLQHNSLRSCVYNSTLNNVMSVRLQVGLYVVYILDWLSVFSSDQLLVLRLEDHAANPAHSMHKIFRFLQLGPISEQRESDITTHPASNTRRPADRSLGPMQLHTRALLCKFYAPFNQKLAEVLQNKSFLWDCYSECT